VIEILLSATSSSRGIGGVLVNVGFWGALFAAMYFLLLRPQRRRLKEGQALQSSIAVDDEIIMNSGIYGFVTAIEGDVLWVDVADGHGTERIEIRVSRGSVARKAPAADAASGDTK